MTCVVGLVDGDRVLIGGDAASTDGWEVRAVCAPKVFRLGEFLIGYTTSFRMGQILEYDLVVPSQTPAQTDYQYLVAVFVEAVREALKTRGYAKIEDHRESGGTFLVGYRGKLYTIDSDFQVSEMRDGYDAVGCGRQYAIGVLWSTRDTMVAERRVYRALEAAEHFAGGVVGPHVVLEGR